jgi:Fur family ferric uptake transcriptional regulator
VSGQIEQALEIFRRFLKSKELKITRQREILLRRIFEWEVHFSAEDLEDRVKGDGISKATIYRTLQLLAECGLISEVALKDDRRMYEHTYGRDPHDHIVCVDCKKVFEFDGAAIARIEAEIAKRLGFAPMGHRLRIEANCEALRKTGTCDRKEVRLA